MAPGVTSATLASISVNGSTATSFFTGCGQDFVGVYCPDASGVLANVNVTGFLLQVSRFVCQQGLGVEVATDGGSASPSKFTIQNVNVFNYDKNGITCDNAGTVCSVSNSVTTGVGAIPLIAQNDIQVFGPQRRSPGTP